LKLLEEAKLAPAAPEVPRERTTSPKPGIVGREKIERIKNDNPIVQVISRYVELRPSGMNLVGLCPFHEDHVPSFTVYPNTGKFHCYGCGKHGDVINFLRDKEGLDFNQALDALDRYSSPDESRPE
jgi:DNA primase